MRRRCVGIRNFLPAFNSLAAARPSFLKHTNRVSHIMSCNASSNCCGGSGSSEKAPATSINESVQNYYGKVLSTTKDLKTSACTPGSKPKREILEMLKAVPKEIKEKYYGCGSPLPFGIEGLNVLDLGSGSGQDCYLAASLVGPTGSVTGVDMTEEQLAVARKYVDSYCLETLKYPKANLTFKTGYIEMLKEAGIENESMDLVISNCVVNLSPDKRAVLQGCFNALREGGELYFSDVYCDRRLPEEVRKNETLWGECIAGALYIEDFKRICHQVGFTDPRQLSIDPITVTDPDLADICGNARFFSITYRCFKLKNLETLCEDYGQVAYYKGTIPTHKHSYALDDHHVFETNRPMLVCGNSASMVGESWLKPHFTIVGDTKTHYGLFDCSSPPPVSSGASDPTPSAGGSCC